MATVTFDRATCIYEGTDTPSVDALDLEIGDGEFLVLVGPSGCGKSTSLRMLAGLEHVHSGSILIDGRDVTETPSKDRDIAMVFQSYALYPHMTVAQNMGFALQIAGVPKAERMSRVQEAARLLDLQDHLDRKPAALSGGQRQRVAMGRAIVRRPQVFLMDEPLSNLDAKLRVQTRAHIAALTRQLGVTTIYVTHDQTEALTMGDRIAVMRDGRLQQVGSPRALYETPRNLFVAGFIGSPAMSFLPGQPEDGGLRIGTHVVTDAELPAGLARGRPLMVGIRPENLELAEDGLPAHVAFVEDMGSDLYVHARLAEGDGDAVLIARAAPGRRPAPGATVRLQPQAGHLHLFDPETGSRIAARQPG